MKLIITAAAALLITAIPLFSQEADEEIVDGNNNAITETKEETKDPMPPAEKERVEPRKNHQIGLATSTIYGTGINYQYLFTDKWRITTAGFIYLNNTDDLGYSRIISAGVGIQRELVKVSYNKTSFYRIYSFGGITYDYSRFHEEEYYYYDAEDSTITTKKNGAALGAGLGFDVVLSGRFSGFIDIGYQYTDYFTNPRTYRLGLGGSIGAGFLF